MAHKFNCDIFWTVIYTTPTKTYRILSALWLLNWIFFSISLIFFQFFSTVFISVMHVDNTDERCICKWCVWVCFKINIVIYHLLNAFKQQKAGKHFAKSKIKVMLAFNGRHTHSSLFIHSFKLHVKPFVLYRSTLVVFIFLLFSCLARFFSWWCFV